MLHVDSVTKAFGIEQVLTDVYLSCTKGEIIGLLGRNGSGKSTLLKIIFGSLQAESKFIKVGNKRINKLTDGTDLIKYLPQNNFLPNHIKIETIINLFCDKPNATLIKDNPLINPVLQRKFNQISGGEKRLLEIFIIACSKADYILIDEPFNGVAPIYKEEIKNLIRDQSRTKGFIITDHDYRNILEIATKTIIINDGGTREIKNMDELRFFGYLS